MDVELYRQWYRKNVVYETAKAAEDEAAQTRIEASSEEREAAGVWNEAKKAMMDAAAEAAFEAKRDEINAAECDVSEEERRGSDD